MTVQPTTPPAPAPTPAPPAPPAPEPTEKTLPQSQVNDIVAREKAAARQAALDEVSRSLGVSVEEAKRILDERKAADDAQKSEAQRAREAADREKDEAQKAKAETAKERHLLWVDAELMKLGAPVEDEKLARLRGLLQVQVGATREQIKADAEKVKEQFPALFGNGTGPGGTPPPPTPGSDPKRTPGGRRPNDDAMARGKARAQELYKVPDATAWPKPPGLS